MNKLKYKSTPNTYRIVTDNIFDSIVKSNTKYNIVIPHVCNNKDIFGGGFTAGIVKHYPVVEKNYHLLGKQCVLGYTQFVTAHHNKINDTKIIFANMIAQNGTISKLNPRPLNYYHLAVCMKTVSNYLYNNFDKDEVQIHAPKFGSGLSGGNWNFVSDLINDIWYNHNSFIYQL